MKAILQYIVLVGIPVLIVLGLLQLGKNLTAPVSVGGVWELASLQGSASNGSCASPLVWSETPALIIAQSGPFLSFAFNDTKKTKLEGSVEGTELTGATTNASESTPGFQINAHIDRQVEPDRLEIALKVRGCSDPIPMVGTRLPQVQGLGVH